MSQTRRLIATIGVLAALGFSLMAVVYWAFVANPPLSFTGIDWPLRILIIAAILSFSIYLIAAPESVGRAASRRSNRLTANALVAGLVALAIAIFANVLLDSVPSVRADLTAGQTFTLSDQTKKVLQDLKKPVTAVAFYSNQASGGVSRQQMDDELKAYQSYSSNFKYEFVDPYVNPARANQYGVTRLGSVVFDNGTKREIANGISEAEFTGALVRLGQTGTQTVAFLTGHGERDMNGTDQGGYSAVRDALDKDNYKTLTWSLVTSPTLTVNQVTVLVIAEPARPITAKELATIGTYLDSGGHLLLLLDPQMPADALKAAESLVQKYGVTALQGGVVDVLKRYSPQDPTVVYVDTYQDSDITRDLNRDHLATLFPFSLMLKPPTSTLGGLTANAFIQTSASGESSWLETDLNSLADGTYKYNEGKDTLGPATLGLSLAADTATNPTSTVKTRIMVYGDADFPSNVILSQGLPIANLDLFANSVSWLAGANELVSIRAKDPQAPRKVALDARQQTVLFASTVCALPLLIALAGTFVWWRRR